MAMYSATTFDVWRSELTALGLSIPDLISEEMNDSPEAYSGWNEQGLLDLFAMDIGIDHGREGSHNVGDNRYPQFCLDCGSSVSNALVVEPFWRHTLEKLKTRSPASVSSPHAQICDLAQSASVNSPKVATSPGERSELSDDVTEESSCRTDEQPLENDLSTGSQTHICTMCNPHRYPPAISESERYIYRKGDKIRKPLSLYYEEDLASKPDTCKGCDAHGYPKDVSIHEKCIYGPYEKVRLHCWLYYIQYGSCHPRVKGHFGYLAPCRCTSHGCWCNPCEWCDGTDDVMDFFPVKDVSADDDDEFSPYHVHT